MSAARSVFDDEPADLLGPLAEPADAFADPSARKIAFLAWVRDDRPWPPPAGLVSAIAGAALGRDRRR